MKFTCMESRVRENDLLHQPELEVRHQNWQCQVMSPLHIIIADTDYFESENILFNILGNRLYLSQIYNHASYRQHGSHGAHLGLFSQQSLTRLRLLLPRSPSSPRPRDEPLCLHKDSHDHYDYFGWCAHILRVLDWFIPPEEERRAAEKRLRCWHGASSQYTASHVIFPFKIIYVHQR